MQGIIVPTQVCNSYVSTNINDSETPSALVISEGHLTSVCMPFGAAGFYESTFISIRWVNSKVRDFNMARGVLFGGQFSSSPGTYMLVGMWFGMRIEEQTP